MNWMTLVIYGVGIWILQDGIASICFYDKRENWRYNHAVRLVRSLMGVALIIIGVLNG